ncbi:MAG: 50S ribosomal protein L3 [Candidatus Paceibacterota bacterium]
MKIILGTKQNMTQLFSESGEVNAVTAIKAESGVVTAVREEERDGYSAVQIAVGERNPKRLSKAVKGHFGDLGSFRYVREFRVKNGSAVEFKRGDTVALDQFSEGDVVELTGISKGKGFQGVVKRHGFAGGRRSHGQKHSEREPGSIGAGGVQRVFKGTRMGGRMGSETVTEKNVHVVKVDNDAGLIYVRGAVPGRRGTLIKITAR